MDPGGVEVYWDLKWLPTFSIILFLQFKVIFLRCQRQWLNNWNFLVFWIRQIQNTKLPLLVAAHCQSGGWKRAAILFTCLQNGQTLLLRNIFVRKKSYCLEILSDYGILFWELLTDPCLLLSFLFIFKCVPTYSFWQNIMPPFHLASDYWWFYQSTSQASREITAVRLFFVKGY